MQRGHPVRGLHARLTLTPRIAFVIRPLRFSSHTLLRCQSRLVGALALPTTAAARRTSMRAINAIAATATVCIGLDDVHHRIEV